MDKSIFAAPSSVFGSNIGRNLTTREVTGDPDEDDSPRDHNDKVHDIPRVPERTDVCQNGGVGWNGNGAQIILSAYFH